jgi:hypothetical protein
MAVQKNDGLHRIECPARLADQAYWKYPMLILRRAWQSSDGRDPQCDWKGWWFLEQEFDQMESVLRHVFSTGFGVLPETQCPGS